MVSIIYTKAPILVLLCTAITQTLSLTYSSPAARIPTNSYGSPFARLSFLPTRHWNSSSVTAIRSNLYAEPSPSASDDTSVSKEDLKERIQQLLLDLSQEENDEIRRAKLSSLLDDRITSNSNTEEAALFAHTWDTTLIEMGSEMQSKARAAAQAEVACDDVTSDDSRADASGKPNLKMESQLWAFVDMMIQSKTFIKKEMG